MDKYLVTDVDMNSVVVYNETDLGYVGVLGKNFWWAESCDSHITDEYFDGGRVLLSREEVEQVLPHINKPKIARFHDSEWIEANLFDELSTDTITALYGYIYVDSLDENVSAEPDEVESDMVSHPSHYTSGSREVIDLMREAMSPEEFDGFLVGNILKYTLRAKLKGNAAQDMAKVKQYADFRIDHLNDDWKEGHNG
jgi:hypothetical protein